MGRAAGGAYTLASGNPVVTATSIDISWANDTLTDLETAMTDSLSRSGLGGMTASFKGIDGSAASPGIHFSSNSTTGLFYSSGDIGLTVAGVLVGTVETEGLRMIVGTKSLPSYAFTGDPDSGLYWVSANKIGMSAGDKLIMDWDNDGVNIVGTLDVSGTITGPVALATLASTVTVVASSDASASIAFFDSATGDMAIKTDPGLTYNASTNALTAVTFVGALTGNVTGNVTGSSGSCTGNSATASAWATGRTITLTGDVTGVSGSWTGSGNISFSTVVGNNSHTHNDSTIDALNTSALTAGVLGVARGGTGAGTFTNGGVLLGSGTSAITAMGVLANSAFLVGDGTTDPVAETGNTLRTSMGIGTGNTVTCVDFVATSDIALKENIRPYQGALAALRKIHTYKYDRKDNGAHYIGVIAQEVLEVAPEIVIGEEGELAVSSQQLLSLTIAAVNELAGQVHDYAN